MKGGEFRWVVFYVDNLDTDCRNVRVIPGADSFFKKRVGISLVLVVCYLQKYLFGGRRFIITFCI